MWMECPKCHSRNPISAEKCNACGSALFTVPDGSFSGVTKPLDETPLVLHVGSQAAATDMAVASVPVLRCTLGRLDFGVLGWGRSATGRLRVEGGPGQVISISEQVVVAPDRFGPEPTTIEVLVRPGADELLLTGVRLLSGLHNLDIPIAAQWLAESRRGRAAAAAPLSSLEAAVSVGTILIEPGDTEGLESALRIAEQGEHIALASGLYTLMRPLMIRRDVALSGAGPGKTRLACHSGPSVLKVAANTTFAADGITFQYLGRTPSDMVHVDGGNVRFTQCRFLGGKLDREGENGGCGLRVTNAAKGTISDCECAENEADGINMGDEASLVLQRCHVHSNGDCGMAYLGGAAGMASENECSDNGSHGIYLDDDARPELASNVCDRNASSGVFYCGRAAGHVFDNSCNQNGAEGICVQDRAAPQLESNRCNHNQDGGIVFLGQAGGVASENTCCWNTGSGIYVAETACPVLRSNYCTDNQETVSSG